MSFVILFILLIGFVIYMWLNEGYIYIASKHFEKEISVEKMKNKNVKNKCATCHNPIAPGEKYCPACKKRQLESYSSSNDFLGNNKNYNSKSRF